MTELKPCPFCGGQPRLIEEMRLAKVACVNRGCNVEPETPWLWSVDEATEAWNTRAERTCRIEQRRCGWYCTACGELVGSADVDSELCIDGNAIELWNFCPNCGAKVVE